MPTRFLSRTEIGRLESFPEEIDRDELAEHFSLAGEDLEFVRSQYGSEGQLGIVVSHENARPSTRSAEAMLQQLKHGDVWSSPKQPSHTEAGRNPSAWTRRHKGCSTQLIRSRS